MAIIFVLLLINTVGLSSDPNGTKCLSCNGGVSTVDTGGGTGALVEATTGFAYGGARDGFKATTEFANGDRDGVDATTGFAEGNETDDATTGIEYGDREGIDATTGIAEGNETVDATGFADGDREGVDATGPLVDGDREGVYAIIIIITNY